MSSAGSSAQGTSAKATRPAASPASQKSSVEVNWPTECARSAAFSPDGRSLYVLQRVKAVNVWAATVHYWPEILGGMVALWSLLWGLRIVWIVRRPIKIGDPYCRVCGYNVVAQAPAAQAGEAAANAPSPRCPECGVDLRRKPPFRGQRLRRRLVLPVTLLAIPLSVYATMHILALPRDGPAVQWFTWLRIDLADWATSKKVKWLLAFASESDHVVELDAATGRTIRTICTRPHDTRFPIAVSPDGAAIFLADGYDGVARIDTRTGKQTAAARCTGAMLWYPDTQVVVAFGGGGRTVYLSYLNTLQQQVLAEWNVATGVVIPRLKSAGVLHWPGDVVADRRDDPTRFVMATGWIDPRRGPPRTHSAVKLFDVENGGEHELDIPAFEYRRWHMALTPDGSRMIRLTDDRLMEFSLPELREVAAAELPRAYSVRHAGPLVDDSGQRLFYLTEFGHSVMVYDRRTRDWVARLVFPDLSDPTLQLVISPDGRRAAVLGTRGGFWRTIAGSRHSTVALFDLRQSPATRPGDAANE